MIVLGSLLKQSAIVQSYMEPKYSFPIKEKDIG